MNDKQIKSDTQKRLARMERETNSRLTRIESKLVRGFEEIGISTDKDTDWLTVDDKQRTVYVTTIGRSLMVLLADMARQGATHEGETYEVVHAGETVAAVNFKRVV